MSTLNLFSQEAYNDDQIAPFASGTTALVPSDVEVSVYPVNNDIPEEIAATDMMLNSSEVAVESINIIGQLQAILWPHRETGMSPYAVRLFKICTEDMYDRLGAVHRPLLPSLEAFSNPHTSGPATRIAVEDLTDFFKKLWAGIVSVFTRIYEAIRNFFSGAINAAEEKRAEAYQREIAGRSKALKEKKQESLPTDGVITSRGILLAFSLPGKKASLKTVNDIIDNATNILTRQESLNKVFRQYIEAVNGSIIEFQLTLNDPSKFSNNEAAREKIIKIIEEDLNPWFESSFTKVDSTRISEKAKEYVRQHPESKNTLMSDYLVFSNQFIFFKEPVHGSTAFAYEPKFVVNDQADSASVGEMNYPTVHELEDIKQRYLQLEDLVKNAAKIGVSHMQAIDGIMKRMADVQHTISTMHSLDDETRKMMIGLAHEKAATLKELFNGIIRFSELMVKSADTTCEWTKKLMNASYRYYGV